MKVVKAGYEIMDKLDSQAVLEKIEKVARTCYKSEDKITEGSAEKMVRNLIKRGHEAMLEHFSFSVKFIVDRGVSHEIVRHRVASYAQESTRYCNYGNMGVCIIAPEFLNNKPECDRVIWMDAMATVSEAYTRLIKLGWSPQEARGVLPTNLKTEVVMTANLREWRHFFKLRALGMYGEPHPQIKEVALPLLKELSEKIPVVFDDLMEGIE